LGCREFVILLGGAARAAGDGSGAAGDAGDRVRSRRLALNQRYVAAIRQGLGETGYVEGRARSVASATIVRAISYGGGTKMVSSTFSAFANSE
jgi:hypothetical protein